MAAHDSSPSPPPTVRSQSRWVILSVCLALAIAIGWRVREEFVRARLSAQDKSVATFQIRAALDQFLLENPTRLFVRYEELIGPTRYLKSARPAAGENYRELFPLRRYPDEFAITMGDGRRVIVFEDGFLRQRRNGEIPPRDNKPEHIRAYAELQKELRKPDGPQVVVRPNAFRLETTFRDGRPDGPFRYYFPSGKLWGEGTYRQGRVVGLYREYDPQGALVYEEKFEPLKR
jgi:hypothetical protein